MAKQTKLYLTQDHGLSGITFANSDATTIKDIYTPSTNNSLIKFIAITSSSADNDLLLYLNNGTTDFLLGHVDIAANAGFNGTVNQVNGLNRTNLPALEINANSGLPFLALKTGWKLRGAMKTTITSGTVTVTVGSEDF